MTFVVLYNKTYIRLSDYQQQGDFLDFFMYFIQPCFNCRPSDSTVSEDAGIEPRTVATSALPFRRSNHSARSHPQLGYISSTHGYISSTTRLDLPCSTRVSSEIFLGSNTLSNSFEATPEFFHFSQSHINFTGLPPRCR